MGLLGSGSIQLITYNIAKYFKYKKGGIEKLSRRDICMGGRVIDKAVGSQKI